MAGALSYCTFSLLIAAAAGAVVALGNALVRSCRPVGSLPPALRYCRHARRRVGLHAQPLCAYRGLRWRAGAAVAKGASIAFFGVGVAVEVALKLVHGVTPVARTMVLFGSLALAANLVCLALLYRFRNRDVNLSSTLGVLSQT